MEELVRKGMVRSIGLSNFNSEQIVRVLKSSTIKPVMNQIECSPSISQRKLIEFCKERDILVTAYTPLAKANVDERKPDFLFNEDVIAIGKKYGKTAVQITLRYLVRFTIKQHRCDSIFILFLIIYYSFNLEQFRFQSQ